MSRGSKWRVLDAGKKYLEMPVYEGHVPEEVGRVLPWLLLLVTVFETCCRGNLELNRFTLCCVLVGWAF